MGILAFIFMLSVIVIIHELGHFLVAKYFGVYCHEFSIGMGPAIYQKKGKETTFSIRAIPLGGYVMMAGENDGSQDEDEDDWLQNVPQDRRINVLPAWKQICVMIAGVVMNFVLALVLFVGLAMARGYVVEEPKPIVYEVVENSPAQMAGMQVDDEIIRIENKKETIQPETQMDVIEFVQFHKGVSTYTVQRGDEIVQFDIEPSYDEEMQGYTIGMIAQAYARPITKWQAIGVGCQEMWDSGTMIFRSLGKLIQGIGIENLSGPVGIYKITQKSAEMGMMSYLSLFAMISLNIGVFNLIPIPALDGGRILILLIEKLLGRKINQNLVEKIIMASFILLFGLMIYATFNDVMRFFI